MKELLHKLSQINKKTLRIVLFFACGCTACCRGDRICSVVERRSDGWAKRTGCARCERDHAAGISSFQPPSLPARFHRSPASRQRRWLR